MIKLAFRFLTTSLICSSMEVILYILVITILILLISLKNNLFNKLAELQQKIDDLTAELKKAGSKEPILSQPERKPVVEAPSIRQQAAAVKPTMITEKEAEKKEPVIRVGNLDPERDFTDVRDVAAAYMRLARDGRPGEGYLVCSGRSVSIRVLLDTLIELNGVPVEVVTDGNRMNPSDVPCLYGDYAKLERDTGWRPRIELRQSLADALADWYERPGPP